MVDTSQIETVRDGNVETLRVTLVDRDLERMSPRQVNDLHVGFILLRAAMLPDSFFDGHPAATADTVDSLMDRIAIVNALNEVQTLPERR